MILCHFSLLLVLAKRFGFRSGGFNYQQAFKLYHYLTSQDTYKPTGCQQEERTGADFVSFSNEEMETEAGK